MKTEPTAASGGTETKQAPQDEVTLNDMPAKSLNEGVRRLALEELALHLTRASALLERCEELSLTSRADQIGSIHAAARLINANAQLARTMAHLAGVERRSRTIVETVQRPDPKFAELNSRFAASLKNAEFRAILEGGLRLLLEVQHSKQETPEAPAIEYTI